MSKCKSKCSECPSLKLVKAEETLKDVPPRNFWNTCPRKLDLIPNTPCEMGKPVRNKKGKIIQEPACEWWIDSEKDNYCFWRYVQNNSLKDGTMDSHLQGEIADKFGCYPTKIHFVLKEAMENLKKSNHLDILEELLQEAPSEFGTPDLPMGDSPFDSEASDEDQNPTE